MKYKKYPAAIIGRAIRMTIKEIRSAPDKQHEADALQLYEKLVRIYRYVERLKGGTNGPLIYGNS